MRLFKVFEEPYNRRKTSVALVREVLFTNALIIFICTFYIH